MKFAGLILCCAPAFAAEFVVLRTGAVLRAERIERADNSLTLHTASGRTELPLADVEAIEAIADPAPPPPVAVPGPEPVLTPPTPAPPLNPRALVTEAAERHGLPPEFVRSVAAAESAFQTKALSHKGAIGLMQLMPDTARQLNADPHDPAQNADAGARLLRDLLIKYKDHPNPVRRALAAYNAGEAAVAKYNGVPPYRETQVYVERVLARYWKEVKKAN